MASGDRKISFPSGKSWGDWQRRPTLSTGGNYPSSLQPSPCCWFPIPLVSPGSQVSSCVEQKAVNGCICSGKSVFGRGKRTSLMPQSPPWRGHSGCCLTSGRPGKRSLNAPEVTWIAPPSSRVRLLCPQLEAICSFPLHLKAGHITLGCHHKSATEGV